MAQPDPHIRDHLEWLGFVQPTGLVVSAPALVKAGAILNRQDREGQALVHEWLARQENSPLRPPDFAGFAKLVLGWSLGAGGYAGEDAAPVPAELQVLLPEGALRPDFAVRSSYTKVLNDSGSTLRDAAAEGPNAWQLLVRTCPSGENFDKVSRASSAADGGLEASAHGRMERMLRETGVGAGLLFNGWTLRLISAPRGESSGWLDFKVEDMLHTAGRPMLSAMRLLLSETRLLGVSREKRLAALLEESRKYQSEVSERLAEQVLHSLYELLRGFQAAHDKSRGSLLAEDLADNPDEVYRGLLTVVLRLVFLLYAEERGLLPANETFMNAYGIAGLFQRLREDAARHPDTMDERFGAYAQLLTLFRMVYEGVWAGNAKMPPRQGAIFDPDRYKFLEGRRGSGARQTNEAIHVPLVSDGTVHRVLEKLMVLDGERVSYRALDIEHIGSVYQTMMGFRLETATGVSIAIKSGKPQGASATINMEALLDVEASKRIKWIRDRTDRKLTSALSKVVHAADSLDSLHAALHPVVDINATPDRVARGSMMLQPSQERRRSGSHYTPRELTEPIVQRTLKPILARLHQESEGPIHPEQVLNIKVCDPAVGSAAFLVEACRQLANVLVEAWHAHDLTPEIPEEESELVFARREIARRCLYGVDRNPKAVDLAKLSLWLATLAKDFPLTFLDHAIVHGDALVGLSPRQIERFHWRGDAPKFQSSLEAPDARQFLSEAVELRGLIQDAGATFSDYDLRQLDRDARDATWRARCLGDLVVAAFFEGGKPKERERARLRFAQAVQEDKLPQYVSYLDDLRIDARPLAPLHWQLAFPEVFDRENPGFDAIVGNPPYAGKNTLGEANRAHYSDWLKQLHPHSHGNADLVAHFFLRAFGLLRGDGAFGLIATNTIAQGDTRNTGLRYICEHGGEIYNVRKRVKWPGMAAVVVSVIHVHKGRFDGAKRLDGKESEKITAFLFNRGGHADPARLEENAGKSFQGSIVLGMGFTFNDTDTKGVATSIAEMRRLIDENPRNREVIYPYIGGEEVNTSPTHVHHRYVINFSDLPLRRAESGDSWNEADEKTRSDWLRSGTVPFDYPMPVAADWPTLLSIVEDRVKPERMKQNDKGAKHKWWQFIRTRPELGAAIQSLGRVLVTAQTSNSQAFVFLPARTVFSHTTLVFPLHHSAAFAVLQSRCHQIWSAFLGPTMKDDLRYTPSDCFETFPFPETWSTNQDLEEVGKQYYDHRAKIMVANDEGLTKTYNRFHHPHEVDQEIIRLRELHTAMDRAVLAAYGWSDICTDCEFLLDYELDEGDKNARKKKPYRYRWPDAVRDDVLARLLDLNTERKSQEALTGKKGSVRSDQTGNEIDA